MKTVSIAHNIHLQGDFCCREDFNIKRVQSVSDYIQQTPLWRDELQRLNDVLLTTPLQATIKWGAPCFCYAGKNVVAMGAFKRYFGLWFYQGALLKDTHKVLINAQAGKTKALRQWRMQSMAEIKPTIIKRYVREALANVDAGREISADRARPVVLPLALRRVLQESKPAAEAFKSLSKGRRREFADYVSEAKMDATKQRRIDKILPLIIAGKGLNDRYRR